MAAILSRRSLGGAGGPELIEWATVGLFRQSTLPVIPLEEGIQKKQ
jgi:hypothetical protein